MKKNMLSTLLILSLLVCAFNVTAFADNTVLEEAEIKNVEIQESKSVHEYEYKQYIMSNLGSGMKIFTRGTSLPTEKHNFDGIEPYRGSFKEVKFGIYTNVYFQGYDKLNVSFEDISVTGNCKFMYGLYDMTDGRYVNGDLSERSFTTNGPNNAYGSYKSLNTTHKYCVYFKTDGFGAAAAGTVKVTYSI